MRFWLAKRGNCLIPAGDEDAETFIKRLQLGECVEVEVRRPRSVAWMRMYFGVCADIGANQDPPRDAASIDAELRIRAGHFDVELFDGLEVRIPKRIAFAEMDADAWEKYWQRVELAICERFGDSYINERRYG